MPVDYDKLMELDYTAYEHAEGFREKLDEFHITHPAIEVIRSYESGIPVVRVSAEDQVDGVSYSDKYYLKGVTREEAEELMFGIWEETLEELE